MYLGIALPPGNNLPCCRDVMFIPWCGAACRWSMRAAPVACKAFAASVCFSWDVFRLHAFGKLIRTPVMPPLPLSPSIYTHSHRLWLLGPCFLGIPISIFQRRIRECYGHMPPVKTTLHIVPFCMYIMFASGDECACTMMRHMTTAVHIIWHNIVAVRKNCLWWRISRWQSCGKCCKITCA